ncbi:MAG: DUF3786 domain-containing protein [Desulfarculaceae bacterium]|nr:DUF3786 domain-containing protein [Desulfarculaceae bacterium]MCF8073601.1 DUF3786 domain-containing protein [Desulfarculaceae bacterium]MCF8103758.1 DUF3786 domain-containing protein [Desulfarculaceae bacterium]MCF8115683.1 DUF3786 domain-containing protein [Desulfarculaceae bacterium]
MARVDDYQKSYDLAAEELGARDYKTMPQMAGVTLADDASYMELNYLGRPVRVSAPPITVQATDDGPEIPLAEQALVLHYLAKADGTPMSGKWITYREVEAGEFYWSAFVKRAKDPLVGFFGHQPQRLAELAPLVGGEGEGETGDVSVIVRAFPFVPVMLVLWEGDDEFPPDGNLLFDESIGHYLSTEDIALTAGMPIYKMMALSRK